MGNKKRSLQSILYGFHRNTNGASVVINKVSPPKRSNSASVIKRKTKTK